MGEEEEEEEGRPGERAAEDGEDGAEVAVAVAVMGIEVASKEVAVMVVSAEARNAGLENRLLHRS